MATTPSSGDLFESSDETRAPESDATPDTSEDPPANSPEDLGFGRAPSRPDDVDRRPPEAKSFGDTTPGPDPVPHNVATGVIGIEDARKFVDWVHEQDLPIHADVTIGHVLVALSGLQVTDLRWLCQGIRQAGKAPFPGLMKLAAMKKDVAYLRMDKLPEKPKRERAY